MLTAATTAHHHDSDPRKTPATVASPPAMFIPSFGASAAKTVNSSTISRTYTVDNNTATPPKKGDLNNDGKVNLMDVSTLLSQWGQAGTGLSGDLNSDSSVNLTDLSLLLANWTG